MRIANLCEHKKIQMTGRGKQVPLKGEKGESWGERVKRNALARATESRLFRTKKESVASNIKRGSLNSSSRFEGRATGLTMTGKGGGGLARRKSLKERQGQEEGITQGGEKYVGDLMIGEQGNHEVWNLTQS